MDLRSLLLDLSIGGFELAGVAVMVLGGVLALFAFVSAVIGHRDIGPAYLSLRRQLEKSILLGLELLIVADIIRSVALEPSFQTIGVLGLLVGVRTFLSWSLEVEIEGTWPWKKAQLRSQGKNVEPEAEH